MEKATKKFTKGQVIFNKGDVDFVFYEILSGGVFIYNDYHTDSEKLLTEMKPGQTFGEMSILSYRARSATAVASEDTEVLVVDDNSFEEYLSENPQRVIAMMKQLSDRTRELTNDYNDALLTVSEIKNNKRGKGFLERFLRFASLKRMTVL